MVAGTGQSKINGGAQWTLSGILDNPDAFEAEMTNGDGKVEEEEAVGEDKGAEEGYCVECEEAMHSLWIDQPASVYCETLCPANDGIPAADTDGEPKDADADESVEDDGADEPLRNQATPEPYHHLPNAPKSALHVSVHRPRRYPVLQLVADQASSRPDQRTMLHPLRLMSSRRLQSRSRLFEGRDFAANEAWFARVFEIGRRHKIMNPDKMRETYGKLIYLLMDARSPDVSDLLGFSPISPLVTVYSTLEAHDALAVLEDPRLEIATREIISPPGASGRVRAEVQRNIKEKERAVEALVNEYAAGEATGRALRSARRAAYRDDEDELEKVPSKEKESEKENRPISAELLRQCIYSISDNSAFLRVNRDPCEIMIGYLKKYFHPTKCTPTKTLEDAAKVEQPSLAIKNGRNGARLSHDHSKQYTYVLQSLTLWREILGDMFHLWTLAETDLLSTTSMYRLRDTGQGLNRVQHAPKTSREMHAILGRAQRDLGSWVGSSTQVYRILLPITNVLSHIANDARVRDYAVREFGGVEEAIRVVLVDFFRSAFDGSGADSYFDAGSCIDGRLTSAWNWCSLLEKKSYFPLFLLSGFIGFDGQW
ncbi:B-box zinc finger [Rhizoctonia solani]|uniref:B-box zinc finger n=1 Tax=Rhizoctonia solani TaxID=456999 RepID=A0A8H7IM84_9AGAM|nr:B-box zinc finger [Rhizoctonia solani]